MSVAEGRGAGLSQTLGESSRYCDGRERGCRCCLGVTPSLEAGRAGVELLGVVVPL